jgi:thioredoxin reductase (NADPH)
MAKPVLISVDDEPEVLNAIERDLRQHYQADYRMIKAGSGAEALDVVKQLKQRGDPVALFLVDQRMPQMSGTEFLAEAQRLYPQARKVLLTAYADTEAAIQSINDIGLDHYLMKPWDPPELNLFPVLDDLLSDWLATVPIPFDGIRVAGTLWSPTSHDVKHFLARNQVPYQWLDIEASDEVEELVGSVEQREGRLPVVFFPDGEVLVQPDNLSLAKKVGLQTEASEPFYDLIILGAGPAGLGAGVYGASEGLRTAMIEKEAPGGQAGTSSRIENYLGFPKGLSGADLARRATSQAKRLGAEILTAVEATDVRADGAYRHVALSDGSELSCHGLIVATGVTVKELDVPGVKELTGAGIYYGAALTEAAYYKDREVFVIGGANSAGQGAMFFSKYASKVTILVRGTALEISMSQYLVDQIDANEKIEVLLRSSVAEAHGDDRLEALTLHNRDTGESRQVPAAALFIFIGAVPHSEAVNRLVECNRAGFILTGSDFMRDGKRPPGWSLNRDPYLLETSVPGIFAAGDVRQGAVRRVASAVGEGAIAVSLIHQYLKSV